MYPSEEKDKNKKILHHIVNFLFWLLLMQETLKRMYLNSVLYVFASSKWNAQLKFDTVCPRNLAPFYIVTCLIIWVKNSCTYSKSLYLYGLSTGESRSYRNYILQITKPAQYR